MSYQASITHIVIDADAATNAARLEGASEWLEAITIKITAELDDRTVAALLKCLATHRLRELSVGSAEVEPSSKAWRALVQAVATSSFPHARLTLCVNSGRTI